MKIGAIEVNRPYPLNPDIGKLMQKRKRVISVENNYSGQLAELIAKTFLVRPEIITKYDGETFYPAELAKEIEQKINNKQKIIEA